MSPWFSNALLRAQSDERLVVLARAGHEGAFVAIVERYRRPLHAFARRLVPDARVEDVLQQAFVNAWAALDAGAEVRHLRGWLHQIVRNAAVASARRPGDAPLSETMLGEEGPQAEVERRLEVRETLHNVAQLPHHQRTVIVQTAVAGRSREEVAADLGLTEGAVRGLLHRARTTLRAAATAVTPLPLAAWAASGGGRGLPFTERIVELAAGAGSASIAGATVKAGGAVVVSGALATSLATDLPPVRHDTHHRGAATATTEHATRPAATSTPTSLGHAHRARVRTHPAVAPPRAPATRLVAHVRSAPPSRPVKETHAVSREDAPAHHRVTTRRAERDDDEQTKAIAIPVSHEDGDDGQDTQAAHTARDDHGDGDNSHDGGGDATTTPSSSDGAAVDD